MMKKENDVQKIRRLLSEHEKKVFVNGFMKGWEQAVRQDSNKMEALVSHANIHYNNMGGNFIDYGSEIKED